ncbi:MAG: alpha-galactosidase, partial [Acidimicrobiales bacterium]
MSSPANKFVTLGNERVSVVIDLRHGAPKLMHVGAAVPGDPVAQALALGSAVPTAGLDGLAPRTLLPEASLGFPARPGIEGHRHDGSGWAPRMVMADV